MEIHTNAVHAPVSAEKVAAATAELSPMDEETVLRNCAISAIMDMDIQDVVKYLSYIENGRI